MSNRAVMRGSAWLGVPLAISLAAAGCAMEMDAGDEPLPGDQAGIDQATPESTGDEVAGEDEEVAPDEPGTPEEVGDTEQEATTVMGVDFEDYAAGPLGAPWQVSRSLTGQATIENAGGHGQAIHIHGSPASGDFVLARLSMSVPSDLVASVDVNPADGAAFVWTVHGTGVSLYKRRIRLERSAGTERLIASAPPSGDTDCGAALPSGTWSTLTLVVHTAQQPSTFDVLVDGNATECSGLAAYVTKPFNMLEESWTRQPRTGAVTYSSTTS